MARYVDPTGTKFWEIERAGETIVRRSGKLGAKGRAQSRTFASALHARREYGSFVGYKTFTEKYVLDGPPPSPKLDDFPFDDDARLVHADLLQSRGDPLGELVVLQHRAAQTEDFQASQKLQREIEELLAANAETWFGDLWRVRDLCEFAWRLGRLQRVGLGPTDTVSWKRRIAELLPDVPLVYLLDPFLEALFDLDIARSLEELELVAAHTMDMQSTMQTLVRCAPPTLRRLEITRPSTLAASEYGCSLYPMRFPALEEFRCEQMDLGVQSLAYVATAEWPKLHTLAIAMPGYSDAPTSLRVAGEDVGNGVATLAPLLRRTSLRCLELRAPEPTLLARAIIAAGVLTSQEIVIRSKRPIDPAALAELARFNPNASYSQMPAYSMRPG